MSFGKFFGAKTSLALFISVENCLHHCKKAIKVCVIDVKITLPYIQLKVSNYEKFNK